MEAACFSETSVYKKNPHGSIFPEDDIFRSHHRENLKLFLTFYLLQFLFSLSVLHTLYLFSHFFYLMHLLSNISPLSLNSIFLILFLSLLCLSCYLSFSLHVTEV